MEYRENISIHYLPSLSLPCPFYSYDSHGNSLSPIVTCLVNNPYDHSWSQEINYSLGCIPLNHDKDSFSYTLYTLVIDTTGKKEEKNSLHSSISSLLFHSSLLEWRGDVGFLVRWLSNAMRRHLQLKYEDKDENEEQLRIKNIILDALSNLKEIKNVQEIGIPRDRRSCACWSGDTPSTCTGSSQLASGSP